MNAVQVHTSSTISELYNVVLQVIQRTTGLHCERIHCEGDQEEILGGETNANTSVPLKVLQNYFMYLLSDSECTAVSESGVI